MHPKYDAKPGGLHIDLTEMHTLLKSCYAKGLRSMSFCVYLKKFRFRSVLRLYPLLLQIIQQKSLIKNFR